MANKDNLIKLVARKLGPDNLKQMVDEAQKAIAQDPDITPEVIDEIIEMFEFVAENPDQYQAVVQQAIQIGAMDEGDLPPEFDPETVAVILLAFYGLRDLMSAQQMPQMAQGGLASMAKQIQAAGRNGDTMLAHITPQEAALLRRRGGSGTINPVTGLPEFFFKKAFKKIGKVVGKVVKAVAPTVIGIMTGNPWLAAAAGAALGATGGGGLKGAVLGGLGGYLATPGNELAGTVGGYASKIPGVSRLGLSNQVLGSGILGGASSALAGRNPVTGALLAGTVANYAPGLVDKYGNMLPEGMAQSIASGANMAASSGAGLKGTLKGGASGALANLVTSGFEKMGFDAPSAPDAESGTWNPATGKYDGLPMDTIPEGQGAYGPDNKYIGQNLTGTTGVTMDPMGNVVGANGQSMPQATGALTQTAQAGVTPTPSSGFDFKDMAKLALVGSLLSGQTPTQAEQNIQDSELTAQQKEAMLRGLTNYRFDPGMTTFPAQGTPAYEKLMSDLSQGIQQNYSSPTLTEVKAKGGRTRRQPQGALSQMSYAVQGPGTGRSDSIEARLSDGEYVIDAETVALLGNGSTKAGAAMLDQMRQGIRQQKGKALAKGKFSPDAKSPLAYMKGGLR
jgi:hypothetical protein